MTQLPRCYEWSLSTDIVEVLSTPTRQVLEHPCCKQSKATIYTVINGKLIKKKNE